MARMNWRILGVSIAMVVFNLEAAAAIGQEKIKFSVGVGTDRWAPTCFGEE
ncbi:MAG: hypothetical protein ACXWW4_17020 [Candidatus Binatia bacterium]